MNDEKAPRAMRRLRERAEAATASIPLPDVDDLIREATKSDPRFGFGSLVPRLAAAAAVVVVTVGVLTLAAPPRQIDPVVLSDAPEHLSALVDDLYDDGSYILSQIAPRWDAQPGEAFLDDVWGDVFDRLREPGD